MPLARPTLDSRTYDELVAESVARIPGLAPSWTDHNASDPGITLVELLSWLVERDLFRLDQLTQEQVRAFLELLGSAPRDAGVASTVVTFRWGGAAPPPTLPAGLQLCAGSGSALFETDRRLVVSPARLTKLGTGAESAIRPLDGPLVEAPLGDDPRPGDALYLGFDAALGMPGTQFRLALVGPDPTADEETWEHLRQEYVEAAREASPGGAPPRLRRHPDAEIIWEYHVGDGSWSQLPRVQDSSRALTLSGWVTFRVPADHVKGGLSPDDYCIRARLACGTYGRAPRLDAIHANAVPARHAVHIDPAEDGGRSRGHAGARFDLSRSPVVPGTLRVVWTDAGGAVSTWQEVHDWVSTGPSDTHALLDADRGTVTFGDGLRGRVPSAGAHLSVTYQVGSGPDGNLARGTLDALAASARNATLVDLTALAPELGVAQVTAAAGGDVGETLSAANARVVARIECADKAVTLADFERIAVETPGQSIARARAIPAYDELLSCVAAAGLVTVVVVPGWPGATPTPTGGMLSEVARHLDRRRLITTQVKVIAPCYDKVSVTATLDAEESTDPAAVEQIALARINRFLHPLTGGRGGTGYPIGRPVYLVEIIALLADVPGVTAVGGVAIALGDDPPDCANGLLGPTCLPSPGAHQITVTALPAVRVPTRRTDDCR